MKLVRLTCFTGLLQSIVLQPVYAAALREASVFMESQWLVGAGLADSGEG